MYNTAQCYKPCDMHMVRPAATETEEDAVKEVLCADAASLDLQLSLPGVDHFQAACQLSLQVGDVTQFMLDVIVKSLFRQTQLQRFILHIHTPTLQPCITSDLAVNTFAQIAGCKERANSVVYKL